MARWVAVAGLGGLAGGGFLAVVACALALVAVVAALCATHFRKENKARNASTTSSSNGGGSMDTPACNFSNFKLPPKSPGRALINTLSRKKLLVGRIWGRSEEEELKAYDRAVTEEEGDFLWQRNILMGERCQPPDFSGVIIYDQMGNRLPEFPPKSPKLNRFHPSLQADAQR